MDCNKNRFNEIRFVIKSPRERCDLGYVASDKYSKLKWTHLKLAVAMHTPFKYKSLNFAHHKLPDIVQLFRLFVATSFLLTFFCCCCYCFCLRGNVVFIVHVTVNQMAREKAAETLSKALGRLVISNEKKICSLGIRWLAKWTNSLRGMII